MRPILQIILALALASPAFAASIFGDRVLAKGKDFQIMASQVEEAFINYKANQITANKPVPKTPDEVKRAEQEILDHMIATKLFMARAIEADRTNAAAFAENFIREKKSKVSNEASFRRQMLALGLTVEQFERQIHEQALVKAVIDRELRAKQTVTDADIEKFYQENPQHFLEPEKWKVAHVHLSIMDRATLKEISNEDRQAKDALSRDIVRRGRGGEDFAALAKKYSDDILTRDSGGEYTMMRGQMPPEFEVAATTLKPGQVSDVIRTRYGWHIIKLIEHIPARTSDLAEVKEKIRDSLLTDATQKALPAFIQQLRQEAGVEVLAQEK